jgi:hypothetical protein
MSGQNTPYVTKANNDAILQQITHPVMQYLQVILSNMYGFFPPVVVWIFSEH